MEWITPIQAGSIVTFGHYEQGRGQEPIEWIVIACDDEKNHATLLSRYGLDSKVYHHKAPYPTWEKSDIRMWLNSAFLNAAFTPEEQACIAQTTVHTEDNRAWEEIAPDCGWHFEPVSGGRDCTDKVFLLSLEEAMKYGKRRWMSDFYEKRSGKLWAEATAFAVAQGVGLYSRRYTDGIARCSWWLRSPGVSDGEAAVVTHDGTLEIDDVFKTVNAVRPALVLDLRAAERTGTFSLCFRRD